MSNKLISIVILNWNRKEYSQKTIENIIARTTLPNEIILVDNDSSEESGMRKYLDTVVGNSHTVDVKRIYNSRNMGIPAGRNTGLAVATGDVMIFVDDDVIVPPKWDVLIVDAFDKVPRLGLSGVNVESHKFPVKVVNGVRLRFKAGNLGGACLAFPRRVFKRLGYFMAENLYGMEDVELTLRVGLAGLMAAYIEPSGIHFDNDSLKAYRIEKTKAHTGASKQLIALNKFRKKYGEQIKTGNFFVPWEPNNFNPVDEDDFTNELVKKG